MKEKMLSELRESLQIVKRVEKHFDQDEVIKKACGKTRGNIAFLIFSAKKGGFL